MPLIALASVKSSPGVTTTALALASAWKTAERRLLVEADPARRRPGPVAGPARRLRAGRAGGGGPARPRGGPGVAARPGAGRRDAPGHRAGRGRAGRRLRGRPDRRGPPAGTGRRADEPVLADCGRLYPGSPALAVAAAAALTLLVVRPRVSELAHLEPRIRGLEQAGLRLAVILAADGRRAPAEPSYPAEEIAGVLGVPVQATAAGRPAGGGAAVPPRRRPRAGAAAAAAARGRRRRRGAGGGPGAPARRAGPPGRAAGP